MYIIVYIYIYLYLSADPGRRKGERVREEDGRKGLEQPAGMFASEAAAAAATLSKRNSNSNNNNNNHNNNNKKKNNNNNNNHNNHNNHNNDDDDKQWPFAGGPCWVPLPPVTYVDSLTPGFLFYRWGVLPGVSSRYVGLLGLPFPPCFGGLQHQLQQHHHQQQQQAE